jgi:hypothetical protein
MNATTFYEQEYIALRGKIELKAAEMSRLQILTGGANAAVYAWLLSGVVAWPAAVLVAFVPLVVTIITGLRHWAIVRYVDGVSAYIRTVETFVLSKQTGPKGWENYYATNNVSSLKLWRKLYWYGSGLFCIAGIFVVDHLTREKLATGEALQIIFR